MTAVRKQVVETKPLDWSEWIEAGEAAARLDKSPGHFRRECARLAERGLAIYAKPVSGGSGGGGNPRWYVARRLEPMKLAANDRLAEKFQHPHEEWAKLTDKQRADAERRKACVMTFRDAMFRERGNQTDWMPPLVATLQARYPQISISERSLRRWHADYNTPADILKLVDRRGGDQKSQGDPAAWAFFESIFLDERKPTIRGCWKRAKEYAAHQSLSWCSEHSCKRQLDARIPPEKQAMHRDPRMWRSQFAPFIEQDPERFAANQCWVADHRPLDMMCRVTTIEGERVFRPYITIWHDWRTRKIVGWAMSESPDSTVILAALRMGIMDPRNCGGPGVVWLDNGRDFVCVMFIGATKQMRRTMTRVELEAAMATGLFGRLHIEPHFSIPYGPQGKARCESVFSTVGDHFDKTFATYTGNAPEAKPEQLREILKKAHLVPTFEHVRERFGEFVRGYNATTDHTIADLIDTTGASGGGEKLSRAGAFAKWAQARMMPLTEDLDLCMQHFERPQRVGRNGVTLRHGSVTIRYGQFEPRLTRLKGTEQQVRIAFDPDNMNAVRVYTHPDLSFVCEAQRNASGGRHDDPLQHETVKRLNREKAAHNRRQRESAGKRELEYLPDEELLAQMQARDPRNAQPPAPALEGSLQIRQTPLKGVSKQLERERFRKAAGAESIDVLGGSDDDAGDILARLAPSRRRHDEDLEPIDFLSGGATFAAAGDDTDTPGSSGGTDDAVDLLSPGVAGGAGDESTDEHVTSAEILEQFP